MLTKSEHRPAELITGRFDGIKVKRILPNFHFEEFLLVLMLNLQTCDLAEFLFTVFFKYS